MIVLVRYLDRPSLRVSVEWRNGCYGVLPCFLAWKGMCTTQRKTLVWPRGWAYRVTKWEKYLRAAGKSQETIKSRIYKLHYFASTMGKPFSQVGFDDIVSVLARKNWAAETRYSYKETITSFYRYLVLSHNIGQNSDPTANLPTVKRSQGVPHPIGDMALREAFMKANGQERLMLLLGADAGLRRGEMAAVHSADVSETAGRYSLLVHGKGGRERIVPVTQRLAASVLQAHGYVFPGRFGGHVEASYISRHLKRILPKGYSAHSLRHRYATRAYQTSHDIYAVAALLGHKSVETTQVYAQLDDTHLRDVAMRAQLEIPPQ